jgi:hypothetical protein
MKAISSLLAILLIFCSVTAAAQTEGTVQSDRIKSQVLKRGERSKVKVTMANETMVKGYISRIEESFFEVNVSKTGQTTSISYADVQKIQGPGLSTGVKIAIGVGVGVAIVALVIGIEFAKTRY